MSWDTTFFVSHGIIRTSARTRRRQRRMSCYTTFQGVTRKFLETKEISEQCRVTRHFNSEIHAARNSLDGCRKERTFSCHTTFAKAYWRVTRHSSPTTINMRLSKGFRHSESKTQTQTEKEMRGDEFFFLSPFIFLFQSWFQLILWLFVITLWTNSCF